MRRHYANLHAACPRANSCRWCRPLNQQTGLGTSRLNHLVAAFGNEMNVIHRATQAQLVPLVGYHLAEQIVAARQGKLDMKSGAGELCGKLVGVTTASLQLQLF